MFNLGWPEIFLIVAVGVLVIGPSEIPAMMYRLGQVMRRLQYMRFALSQQFENFMQDAEKQDNPLRAHQENLPDNYEEEFDESTFDEDGFDKEELERVPEKDRQS